MRFTLGKMFLAIAMLALACAGMKYHTGLWERVIASGTIAMYAAAIIPAIGLHGRQRVLAAAFSFIGGLYLLLVFTEWRVNLITNDCLVFIARIVSVPGAVFPALGNPHMPSADELLVANNGWSRFSSLGYFMHIGHCVFSWLFAVLAAWFAGRVYDRRERGKEVKP